MNKQHAEKIEHKYLLDEETCDKRPAVNIARREESAWKELLGVTFHGRFRLPFRSGLHKALRL
jgi:hypothetical protein